jgi:hypothetical protein
MKNILIPLFCLTTLIAWTQPTDSTLTKKEIQELQEVSTDRNYISKYNRELARVRKIYPYALHAAELIDQFETDLSGIDKKRKKKKYSKKAHQMLIEDYNYVIRDLYTSEGVLLMKLIHRETGLTAAQIIERYRGKIRSELYDQLGKIWDQDLDVRYDPTGVDKLTERIIKDIENNTVAFQKEAKIVTKEEYKKNQKAYKINRKEYKKELRKEKRKAR